jgi:hypothetical protein
MSEAKRLPSANGPHGRLRHAGATPHRHRGRRGDSSGVHMDADRARISPTPPRPGPHVRPRTAGYRGCRRKLASIEGESGGDGWKHQHSNEGLRSAASLLRTIHDASIGWEPPAGATFRAPHLSSDSEPPVWCHGDFGPWNIVWRDDEAIGLIDWDFLHLAPRIDDVAYALQWFTPTRDDEMALTWHHFPSVPDRAARVRTFLDAYGGGLLISTSQKRSRHGWRRPWRWS